MKVLTAISAIMVATACSFATIHEDTRPMSTLPTVERVDTRDFAGMRYEREVDIMLLWTLSQMALPNEIAFCLYGHAVDTTMTFRNVVDDGELIELERKIAVIDSVAVANIKEAAPTYVEFVDGIACDSSPRLIGTAHTHPNVPHPLAGGRCSHSDLDVLYAQNRETEYWLTLVMCEWTHEMMWADGRRLEYYVRNPANPLSTEEPIQPSN